MVVESPGAHGSGRVPGLQSHTVALAEAAAASASTATVQTAANPISGNLADLPVVDLTHTNLSFLRPGD
jgi:hypothetical protein